MTSTIQHSTLFVFLRTTFVILFVFTTTCVHSSGIENIDSMMIDPSNTDDEIEVIIPRKIIHEDVEDHGNAESSLYLRQEHRSLQLCSAAGYQYIAQIRDDFTMSYTVLDDRIKIELVRDSDEGWVALGTNPSRAGKMIGGEAWVALPGIAAKPIVYELNGKRFASVVPSASQSLENGEIIQNGDGKTIVRFEKLLSETVNVSIEGDGDIVFIWALGSSNTFGRHRRRGAFRITLETCTIPSSQPEEVDVSVVCGLLGLSVICPITRCGILGRLIGLC